MNAEWVPGLSALLVEPDQETRLQVKRRLKAVEGWSVNVEESDDAEKALERLREASFDVVFLSNALPRSSCLETLSQMRQLREKAGIVVVSRGPREGEAVEAMKRGALDYLEAEDMARFDYKQLLRRILELRDLANKNMELRQINQMKNEFIANVSHELRTPLAAILGFAKTLQDQGIGSLNPEQAKAVGVIIERADDLLKMLNQILRIREADEGQERVLLRALDLTRWLSGYERALPKTLAKKKMRPSSRLPNAPVWVLADPERLAVAVDNLVSNAVKFSPAGSSLEIQLAVKDGKARLSIRDQGPGIPPEVLPHVFERLFATGRGSTREHSGLGLGLPLAQHIALIHGGRLWLECHPEGGTTAHLALPLAPPQSPDLMVQTPSRVQKKRILIVEDNPDLVEVLMLFMSSLSPNLEVTTVHSGFSALESVKQSKPHLIILDIMMPGMSGVEVIDRLRRSQDTAGIPVLVLTGYAEGAQMALQKGAKEVLLKPFEKEPFVRKVMGLLQVQAA